MKENNQSNNAQKKPQRKKGSSRSRIGLRHILIGAAILVIGLFVVGYSLNEISERTKFVTVNALSVLVLVAIAIQALI